MRHLLIILLWLLGAGFAQGQTVYRGRSSYESDVVGTWRDGRLYARTSSYQRDILFTYRDNRVYANSSVYRHDVLLSTSARVHPVILLWIMMQ